MKNKAFNIILSTIVPMILASSAYAIDPRASEIDQLAHVKNAKGEDLFMRKEVSSADESNLWSQKDPAADKIEGTSTEKLYSNITIPTSKKNEIVVAVIDSGVDISHPDLQGKIWINFAELFGIPGVDDDGDGFVDDIFGWNFLGNAKGDNISGQTLEVTREFARLTQLQAQRPLTLEEQSYFAKVTTDFKAKKQYNDNVLSKYLEIQNAYQILKASGLKEETVEAVRALKLTDANALKAQSLILLYLPHGITSDYANGTVEELEVGAKYQFNVDFNSSAIVGDHPDQLNEKGYGNGDVSGRDPHGKVYDAHGTHVSGIIAAVRDNDLGINGQATNVKIMSVRAVPNGDERDKDIGNAIRFAVDHGAKVINMSFGKEYSPNKAYVDAAVQYANSKGVLLVHAAGNDSKNTDLDPSNFPNRKLINDKGVATEAPNWIEVGASDRDNNEQKLAAVFSNYGRSAVDVFAPGVGIVSTIPDGKYASYQGTSMASPEVAGVAALLMSKFPQATVAEIKDAILSSSNRHDGVQVYAPGSTDLVTFAGLSVSGGTVNAYRAMLKLMNQFSALLI